MIYKGTSEPEQSIYYYIKRYFSDAINRYIYSNSCSNSKSVEVDIFIPSLYIAIEYDGGFWHDNKKDIDTLKNEYLNKNGIFIIRIRDINLPELPEFNGKVIYHGKAPKGMHKNECIENVIHELANHCSDKILANQLRNFSLSFEQYIKDLPDIISGMFPVTVRNNKSTFCGAEFWDSSENGKLKLKNIPANSQGFNVNFKCKNGKPIHTTIDCLLDKKECKKNKKFCSKCFNQICLFSYDCQEVKCPIIKQYIYDYLFGKIDNEIDINSQVYKNIFKTPLAINLIRLRLNNDNKEFSDRFNQLFDFPRFGKWLPIQLSSVEDLQLIKDYADKIGGVVNFNLVQLNSSKETINLLNNYLSIVCELLHKYGEYSSFRYYIEFIYYDWKRHKDNINPEIQNVIVKYLKSVDNSMTQFGFKFD